MRSRFAPVNWCEVAVIKESEMRIENPTGTTHKKRNKDRGNAALAGLKDLLK